MNIEELKNKLGINYHRVNIIPRNNPKYVYRIEGMPFQLFTYYQLRLNEIDYSRIIREIKTKEL